MAQIRVKLEHPDLPNQSFDCPKGAVDHWLSNGWVKAESPKRKQRKAAKAAPVDHEETD